MSKSNEKDGSDSSTVQPEVQEYTSQGMKAEAFPYVPSASDLNYILKDRQGKTFQRLMSGRKLTVYPYRSEDEAIRQLMLRFDHPIEPKEVRPLVCLGKSKTGAPICAFRFLDAPRLLYGLELLYRGPDAPVLVVEGEKTADAGRLKFPDHIVITWMSGAKSVGKADFGPLAGRKVVLWPDNDEAGRQAMLVVAAQAYAAGASTISFVDVPPEFGPKWDLADVIPERAAGFSLQELLDTARHLRPEDVSHLTCDPVAKAEQRRLLGHKPGFSRVKMEHVDTALSVLDAGMHGDDWRRIARCVFYAFGMRGLPMFDRWSQRSTEKYRKDEPEKLWEEYKAKKNFRADTLAWLFKKARKVLQDRIDASEGDVPNVALDLEAVKIAAVEELNEKHAVVVRGGKTGVLWESFDPRFQRYTEVYLSKRDFIDRYVSNVEVPAGDEDHDAKKNKLIKQGVLWFSNPWRQSYDGIYFAPGEDLGPRFLNIWRGFAVEPGNDPEGWSKLKHHLLVHVACGDQDAYQYLLNWFAFAVQRLDSPMRTALVLLGPKGAGKSIVTQLFGYLFGQHTFVTSRMDDVTGRFNDRLETTLLLGLEEAVAPQDRAADSTLKDLITRDTLRLEGKFFGVWTAPNHLRIIVTSNNEQVVRADGSERRYAVFEVANPHQADPHARRRYFGEMVQQMETGGYESMLGELLARDISDWNPEAVPETDALRRQKELNQLNDPVCSYLFERLTEGYITTGGGVSGSPIHVWSRTEPTTVVTRDIVADFGAYCDGRRLPFSPTRFARELPRLMPAGFKRTTIRVKGPDDSAPARAYVVPPLETARAHFEQVTRLPINREGEEKQPE